MPKHLTSSHSAGVSLPLPNAAIQSRISFYAVLRTSKVVTAGAERLCLHFVIKYIVWSNNHRSVEYDRVGFDDFTLAWQVPLA